MHLENKIILKCKEVFTREVRIMVTDERGGELWLGWGTWEELLGGMVKFYF